MSTATKTATIIGNTIKEIEGPGFDPDDVSSLGHDLTLLARSANILPAKMMADDPKLFKVGGSTFLERILASAFGKGQKEQIQVHAVELNRWTHFSH